MTYYAIASNKGLWHATTSNDQSQQVATLCGVKAWHDYDTPLARLSEDDYVAPMQFVECVKCENKMRKDRG